MAMYELPLPVFLSENARYSKSHRPNFLRPRQTDLGCAQYQLYTPFPA